MSALVPPSAPEEEGVNLAEIAAVVGAAAPGPPGAAMDVEGGVQVSEWQSPRPTPPITPAPTPPRTTPALLAFPETRILAHTHCVARRQVPMDSSLDSPCEKLAGSTPTTPGGRDLPNELRDL